jgi:hypothetical protein
MKEAAKQFLGNRVAHLKANAGEVLFWAVPVALAAWCVGRYAT